MVDELLDQPIQRRRRRTLGWEFQRLQDRNKRRRFREERRCCRRSGLKEARRTRSEDRKGRHDLSPDGSGNTQGRAAVLVPKAVETQCKGAVSARRQWRHSAKALSQPRRQWRHNAKALSPTWQWGNGRGRAAGAPRGLGGGARPARRPAVRRADDVGQQQM